MFRSCQKIVLGPNYQLIAVIDRGQVRRNLKYSLYGVDSSYTYAFLHDESNFDLSVVSIRHNGHDPKKPIVQKSSDSHMAIATTVRNRIKFYVGFAKNQTGSRFHSFLIIHQKLVGIIGGLSPMALIDSECLSGSTASLPILLGQTRKEVKRFTEVSSSGSEKLERAS
jgi:hypothetical protein